MDVYYKLRKALIGYSDGSIRAFDLNKQKIIGAFKLSEGNNIS